MRALIVSCLLVSFSGFSLDVIKSFPDGIYSGQGYWSDKLGNEGSYDANIKFSENSLSLDYKWGEGALNISLSFSFNDSGWFDVSYGEEKVGEGFCTENQCQYWAELNGVKFNETLVFAHGLILKAGYKWVGDNFLRWEEILYSNPSGEGSDEVP